MNCMCCWYSVASLIVVHQSMSICCVSWFLLNSCVWFSSAFVYMFMKTTPQTVVAEPVNSEVHEDSEPLSSEVSVIYIFCNLLKNNLCYA